MYQRKKILRRFLVINDSKGGIGLCRDPIARGFVKQVQAKPSRLCSNRSKDFAQKTIFAPCEAMILSTVNRTKMFHVKHFCPIGPRNRTNHRVRIALKTCPKAKPSP